jgi:hypothetical protein
MTMFNVMEVDRGTTEPAETLRSGRLSNAHILKWQAVLHEKQHIGEEMWVLCHLCSYYFIFSKWDEYKN